MGERLALRAKDGENGDAGKPGDGGEQRQQDEAESGGIPGVARGAVATAAADGTGDQHGGGDAERNGNGADEIERGCGETQPGDEAGVAEAADKENIDEINDEGGEDADAACAGHVDEMAPDAAFDKGRVGGVGAAVQAGRVGQGKGADCSGFCRVGRMAHDRCSCCPLVFFCA